jgi:hypothetical protein
MPVYHNSQGKVYTATSPQSPNDQLNPFPDPDFPAVLSATPVEPIVAKTAFIQQQISNLKIKKNTGF